MPQIKIRGMEQSKICSISKEMLAQLETIINCPKEYLTIEHIHSTFIADGKVTEGYPFVEVLWFDRGQEVQDQTALAITKLVHSVGYPNVDIIFNAVAESDYYENGEHF